MRALQGLGAAMLNPAAIALIALLFTERDRAVAYGINGLTAAVGVGLGYMLGGLCAEYVSWRWAFYVNLPICVLAAGCVALRASDEEHVERRRSSRLHGRRAKPRRLGPDHLCTHPGASRWVGGP